MNGRHLVDSSGWLEYFTDGPNAGCFAEPLSDPHRLVVPTVSLYEVFRVVLRERGEDDAVGHREASLMRKPRDGRRHHSRHRTKLRSDPLDPGRRLRRPGGRTLFRENIAIIALAPVK